MQIRPLKHCPEPGFPTREAGRWRKNHLALAAIAAVAFASGVSAGTKSPTPPPRLAGVPAPPRFVALSEDEARRVVCREAKKAGISFKPDAFKTTLPKADPDGDDEYTGPEGDVTLVLDGTDSKLRISYEYVSVGDLKGLQRKTKFAQWASSPGRTVNYLNDVLAKKQPKFYFRAFTAARDVYPTGPRAEKRARAAARDDLRNQVKDFVNWLKVHKVI